MTKTTVLEAITKTKNVYGLFLFCFILFFQECLFILSFVQRTIYNNKIRFRFVTAFEWIHEAIPIKIGNYTNGTAIETKNQSNYFLIDFVLFIGIDSWQLLCCIQVNFNWNEIKNWVCLTLFLHVNGVNWLWLMLSSYICCGLILYLKTSKKKKKLFKIFSYWQFTSCKFLSRR